MKSKTQNIALSALFIAAMTAGAKITIPVPPVPVTLQMLFVILSGMVLGKKWGAASMAAYVLLGLVGVPVFAKGGGLSYIYEPSFGYLIGFIFAAFFTGLIVQKLPKTVYTFLIAGTANIIICYLFGLVWLYTAKDIWFSGTDTMYAVLKASCLLFLPKDFVCCLFSAVLCRRLVVVCPWLPAFSSKEIKN